MSVTALFFSRGRGHGHAIPDLAIASEMAATAPDIKLVFASYATGAATFESAKTPVHNLGLPENNPFLATFFETLRLIQQVKPDVVVSHEEFAAVPAAALLGIPSIYISAWFPPENSVQAESLHYASSVIVIEKSGLFAAPKGLAVKPIYVGPILRRMKFTRRDKERLRQAEGIPARAFVMTVVTGGVATEKTGPIFENILSAYLALPAESKRLLWISGRDADGVRSKTAGIAGVTVYDFVEDIERLLSLSDVVITKGTQMITLDCAVVGVPSISLSPGTNPIDEVLIPRWPTNIALNARAVDGEILGQYLTKVMRQGGTATEAGDLPGDYGAVLTTRTLQQEIRRVVKRP